MTTFGEFFTKLRRRIEKTGRTDSQCSDMDRYKDKRCTESVVHLDREDKGWKLIADQELSHVTLLEFSREMTQAGVRRLVDRANSDRFDPDFFGWVLDSVHEFHHAMLEEARQCGLDVDCLSDWLRARGKIPPRKSA